MTTESRTDFEQVENIWDVVAENPAEATNLRARAELMRTLERYIKTQGWTQTEAANHFGVMQPQISDLMRGKINKFSLDFLVEMIAKAGLRMTIKISRPRSSRKDAA